MTYYGGKELAASFRTVRKHTLQVAEDIPADRYDFVAADGVRDVGTMLVHIAIAPGMFWQEIHEARLTTLANFDFLATIRRMEAEEKKPRGKAEIIDLLKAEGERFATFLEGLSEAALAEGIASPNAPGRTRSRFETLMGAKEHEMHHRAQLMLIERQLGIVPHLTRQMSATIAQMAEARKS